MRKVCYISGTRADFGLMQASLQAIAAHPELRLSTIVTGMHLLARYGNTVEDIERAGLPVTVRVALDMEPATGATMARNIGHMLGAFVDALEAIAPDLVLLLGDRGEMLAGALAAIHLNLPVVHIHGGERSGTVDEPVRHAISKLSHYHFTATEEAAARLVRMGESAAQVHVTGAPGLDGLAALAGESRAALCAGLGLASAQALALLVFHPVLQEAQHAAADAACILDALAAQQVQVLALMPNADAGSAPLRALLEQRAALRLANLRVVTHLPRAAFVSWMAAADLMIGNSSAGIIEAATFGTPVINIGSRQGLRERNDNVRDSAPEPAALAAAIAAALAHGRYRCANRYGDGHTAPRIAGLLARLPLGADLLLKSNAY